MDSVLRSPLVTVIQVLAFILLAVWVGVISYNLGNIRRQQRILGRGLKDVNLYEVMISHIERVDEVERHVSELSTEQDRQHNQLVRAVQRVGLVKYDAFDDMGGQLSFALALLDDTGDGVLVTTICGRQETHTYAKDIRAGKAMVALSLEEQQAIKKAFGRGSR